MINLSYTPVRSDNNLKYEIYGDALKVIYNDEFVETFDFTGLVEGKAETIIVETLPINPIISAEKIGDTVNITAIRFYGEDEKEVFEIGYN